MANIQTITQPLQLPWAQQTLADWLFGGFSRNDTGGWNLAAMPSYPSPLSPSLASTMLPNVWSAWGPNDPGQQALQQMMLLGMPQQLQTNLNNVFQYGGMGYPGSQMSLASQYGGAGEPARYMSNVMQFGMPTPASGQGVADMARTGGTGSWGQMLQNYALGMPNPYLAPFLGAKPWQSPSMGGSSAQK